jgi:thiol-disulfide isomerase/thioredoxin
MNIRSVGLLAAVLALFAATPAMGAALGDPAGDLKIATWVKGSPVTLEKGKVYVVEFWATWCGPCRESIPHLTEMQKKFKDKVTFAGISTEELGEVKPFVDEMGGKMDYNVGVDDKEATSKAYMEAYGQDGIPCAFIVNKDKQIAWVGHPMDKMDAVLESVVAGTYDIKAAEQKRVEAVKIEAEERRVFEELDAAVGANDPKKFHAVAQKLLDSKSSNAMLLSQLALMLSGLEEAEYLNKDLSLSLAKAALALEKNDWRVLAAYGAALNANGDSKGATAQIQAALVLAEDEDAKAFLKDLGDKFDPAKQGKSVTIKTDEQSK